MGETMTVWKPEKGNLLIRREADNRLWGLTQQEVRELVKGLLKHSDIAQDTLHDAGWRHD